MALANPHITITAIDLSPTSLAYARQMAERFVISNIQFKLLDILDIDQLGQKFDYIMCTGVLHHMASPQTGLNALSSVLNDKGLMLLGFYSETARHSLSQYKTDIANFLCVDTSEITPKGISQWRSQLSDEDKKSDWFHTNDFFYLNGLMDALVHPVQFEYQLPQLGQMLEQAQLNFQMMAISNMHKAKHQQALTAVDLYQPDVGEAESLEQWHQLELNNPNFFTGMFNFFATKSTQAKA
jgi:2-polyprenyl-3-methyl-5-hydroxy-6-metoxy-1,4-benzoquinol methylase